MKSRITYLVFALGLFFFPSPWGEGPGMRAFAQTVTPTFIGTAGGSGSVGGMFIDYSVGEAAVPTFTVASGTVRAITQGFQQPMSSCPTVASLSTTPTNTVCPGTSVSISPVMTGTTGAETYFWSSGETTSSIIVTPTITTVYTFSVTGCSLTIQTETVTVNPTPTVSVSGGGTTICSGSSATLAASASGGSGFTYVWSTGTSASSVTVTPTTNTGYTVTATNSGGCTAIQTTTVSVNPGPAAPSASASPNPVCVGSTLSLSAGNISGASYAWTGPNSFTDATQNPTIGNITAAGTGNYSVTATLAGCTGPAGTVSVTVNPIPTPSINAAPSLTICDGDLLTLTASGGSTYFWSDGGPNPHTVNPSTNFTYSVVAVIGTCSVSATVSVTVNPTPSVDINGSSPFLKTMCPGEVVTLTSTFSATYTYSWLPVTGLNNASLSNPMASPTVSTEYTVTVTNAGSCSATATASLTISTPMTFTASSNSVSCTGTCDGSASVTPSGGTAPYTYAWSGGGVSSAVSNLCAQTYTVNVTDGAVCTASTTVTVGAPAPLTASTTITQPLCGCNGQATANPTGGTAPYFYSWNTTPQQTTATAIGLCGGTQIVTVTDSKGCNTNANANLTASPGLTVTVTPPSTTICSGSTASIGAFAPGSVNYGWMPGGATTNTISISPTTFTTYTVIATDPISGCSDTGFVAVSVNPLPSASITGNTSICSGQSTTLTAAAGGTGYTWIPANIGQVISTGPLSSNTGYTVTVTDAANCTAVGTTTVFVSPSPTASITATPSTICNGSTVTLSASGGGTYFWINNSSSAAQFTDNPTGNTTYTLVAYNGACSDTAMQTVTISSVSVAITGASPVCVGQNSTLAASPTGGNGPYTYSWSTTPPQTTPSIVETYPTAGTFNYTVTVSDATGCNGTATYSVVVNAAPVPTISANDTTVCLLEAVTLTATGGGTYLWNTGGTDAVITVNPGTVGNNNYSVTVSNGGCSAGTSLNILANALPSVSAGASPATICAGDSSVLIATASSVINYTWSTGGSGPQITVYPSTSTTYTVFVTDNNNCSNSATASVSMNSISVNAGPDITICPGFAATLNAAVTGNVTSYLWSPGSLVNDSTVQNPSGSPVDSVTVFHVTVMSGSCIAKDSVTVYSIRTPNCVIKIYNGITPNGDNDNNTWIIDGIQSYPENKVYIFNRWGTKVWSASGYDNKDIVWKGTDQQGNILSDGTYYYLVELFDGQGGTIFSESSWVEVTH